MIGAANECFVRAEQNKNTRLRDRNYLYPLIEYYILEIKSLEIMCTDMLVSQEKHASPV